MLKDATGIRRGVIVCGFVDLRKRIDGLAQIIGSRYGQNPFEKGTLFFFCGRRSDRMKGLFYNSDIGIITAPLQGLALWNIFLLTTGSFFVISLTDLYVFHGRHLAADVFPTGSHTFQLSCHCCIRLPVASDGGSVQLNIHGICGPGKGYVKIFSDL